MIDYKTSLLVDKQVPEFVREEYPKFIAFLEAYYEFLEQKQGSQINDLTTQAKKLRYISDVDYSLEDFEKNFFNSFASLVPLNLSVDKNFLIKNILPLYLSKGSESSFKLLFRMLFGEELEISYPKDNILRASDGKWEISNVLRIDTVVSSFYTGDGTRREFVLAQETDSTLIEVFINDVLQTSGFYIRKELKRIIFDSAPALNSRIKIKYNPFNTALLSNRKVTGLSSGATAIIEKIDQRTIALENYYQFYIKENTRFGNFINNETIITDILVGGEKVNLELFSLSDIKSITVIDGGANYNVGDSVIIKKLPNVAIEARATIEQVYRGIVENVNVTFGGAGFQNGNNVEAEGISTTFFNALVVEIDSSANNSLNTVTFFTDLITDIDIANVTIGAANYGFPSSNVTENVNTVIAQAFTSNTITSLGPAKSVNVITSLVPTNKYDIIPATVKANVKLNNLGIIGRIEINNGGQNYNVGEYLTFTNQPGIYLGHGANAQISSVDVNGGIRNIQINSGGMGYFSNPIINVSSSFGSNANLTVSAIMGDSESLRGVLPKDEFGNPVKIGQIRSIRVLNPGKAYTSPPVIDLSKSGDGTAVAVAQLQNSYVTLPGRWTTTDSFLSSNDRRLENSEYYIDYTFILSSKIEFSRYKSIFKELIQPAGFKAFAEYKIDNELTANNISIDRISVSNTISGTVNVNNSIYVVGTNTKFNIANSRGILTIGSKVSVGQNVRYVNSIYSNTVFTVNSAFGIISNGQTLIIL